MMCHAIGGVGAEVGPALDGWTRGKSLPVIAAAIIDPDAGIAHGYAGTTIRTTDGLTIQGLLIKEGDPLMMRSMGNVTQVIPASRVKARERLTRSLMMDAAQLGMSAQDVADVVAFLSAQLMRPRLTQQRGMAGLTCSPVILLLPYSTQVIDSHGMESTRQELLRTRMRRCGAPAAPR